MRLNKFDEIQVSGLHPRNPITDEVIEAYLQIFVVTQDVEGDTIPPFTLHPLCADAVSMGRIVRLNGVPIQ